MAYARAHLDELDSVTIGAAAWRPIRRALGVTAIGVNAFTAQEAGAEVIEPHDELSPGAGGHEELYAVLTGHAVFEIDGEKVDAPAGTLLRIDVGTRRQAVAREPDTTVLVTGGPPGAAMPPSPFEHWYAAQGAYDAGDYDRAYEIASAGLADHPAHGGLNYQLACYRALAGDPEKTTKRLVAQLERLGHTVTLHEATAA